jgi:PBP1b-binding outer membrane lipoprotein LpoB
MKKLICILASAALLGACEQKTETVAPAAPAEKKTENNTTVVNPSGDTEKTKEKVKATDTTNTTTAAAAPVTSTETKTDSSTTTTSSPSP